MYAGLHERLKVAVAVGTPPSRRSLQRYWLEPAGAQVKFGPACAWNGAQVGIIPLGLPYRCRLMIHVQAFNRCLKMLEPLRRARHRDSRVSNKFYAIFLAAALTASSLTANCFAQTSGGALKSLYEIDKLMRAGNYALALEAAKQRVDASPNDPIELREYGTSLETARRLKESKAVYEQFLTRFPTHADAAFIKDSLKDVNEALEETPEEWLKVLSDGDYFLLDTLTFSGAKWAPKDMPLKVFIQSAGVAPATLAAAKRAFSAWQNGSGSLVSFVFVPTAAGSNIELSFTSNMSHPDLIDAQGNTTKDSDQGKISHAVIVELTKWHHTDAPVLPADTFETTAHEIGHALGIGHSRVCTDVMFTGENDSPVLTSNDLGMLKRLYTGNPDQLYAHILKCLDDAKLPHDYSYFKFLNEYAENLESRQQYAIAASKYEQIHEGISKLPGKEQDKLKDNTIHAAARCYYKKKDWAGSERCYRLLCDSFRAAKNDKDLAENLGFLAAAVDEQKRYDEEEKLLLEQADLLQKTGDNGDDLGRCYSNLAWIYDSRKQYPQASTYYGRSNQAYKKAGKTAEASNAAKSKSEEDSWIAQMGISVPKQNADPDGYHSYKEYDSWYLENHEWLIENRQEPKFAKFRSDLLKSYGTDDLTKIDALLASRNIKSKK